MKQRCFGQESKNIKQRYEEEEEIDDTHEPNHDTQIKSLECRGIGLLNFEVKIEIMEKWVWVLRGGFVDGSSRRGKH